MYVILNVIKLINVINYLSLITIIIILFYCIYIIVIILIIVNSYICHIETYSYCTIIPKGTYPFIMYKLININYILNNGKHLITTADFIQLSASTYFKKYTHTHKIALQRQNVNYV